jgi:hypothetical protein
MKRAVVVALVLATGCSTASKDIATAYVSPTPYQALGCDQLAAESTRIQTRSNQLASRLDKAADNDKAIMVVGAVLFWPALFALGGTKEHEAEFARLKGENDAVQAAVNLKGCTLAKPGQQTASAMEPATATIQPASTGATAEHLEKPLATAQ